MKDEMAELGKKEIAYGGGEVYQGQVNDKGERHGYATLSFGVKNATFEGIFEKNMMSIGKLTYCDALDEEIGYFMGKFKENQWSDGFYKNGNALYHGLFED